MGGLRWWASPLQEGYLAVQRGKLCAEGSLGPQTPPRIREEGKKKRIWRNAVCFKTVFLCFRLFKIYSKDDINICFKKQIL